MSGSWGRSWWRSQTRGSRTLWTATLSVVLMLVVVLAGGWGRTAGGPDTLSARDPAPTLSADAGISEATASAAPTAVPSSDNAQPTRMPTRGPVGRPVARSSSPAAPPSASPTACHAAYWCADGQEGWCAAEAGYTGQREDCCARQRAGSPSVAPNPALTLQLRIDAAVSSAGVVKATAVVSNSSAAPVSFSRLSPYHEDAMLLGDGGVAVSEGFVWDQYWSSTHEIPPQGSVDIPVTLRARACGDTQDEEHPLPDGEYDAVVQFNWEVESTSGTWLSPPVRVSVHR